jgi:hypothetical protein
LQMLNETWKMLIGCILCHASTLWINSSFECEVKIVFHWGHNIQTLSRVHKCLVPPLGGSDT